VSVGNRNKQEGGSGPTHPSGVDVRQQLAADRTLLAWVRTAIALAGLGFVVAKFNLLLREVRGASAAGSGAARAIGVALVLAAAVALLLGLVQHRQVGRLLADHGDPLPAPGWPAVAAATLALLGIVGGRHLSGHWSELIDLDGSIPLGRGSGLTG
jgi:inner membrane protein YidH